MPRRRYATHEDYCRANREASARRSRERNDSIKEIGPLPSVQDPMRKARCRESLLDFMMTYGGSEEAGEGYDFTKPFCPEQIEMIHSVEDVLMHGGEMPLCIFRGGCKTTICEWGVLWSMVYGWQRFCLVVAASAGMSKKIVANVRRLIEVNALLQADFPEVCWPIQCLERIMQRARAQKLDGENTNIVIKENQLILPTVPGYPSSGAILMGVGSEASFRGLREGTQRPTVVLIDDPQTNKSARSETQTNSRWENITTSIKGLAGPGVDLALIATITVIRKGDLAEKILEKWGGKRYGILRSMPKNLQAWTEYGEEMQRVKIAVSSIPERNRIMNEYYLSHRDVLDEGAEAAWEQHYTESEVSAIQHAMHLYLFDQKAFWSEYMNEPLEQEMEAENLTQDDLLRKIRADLPKGIAPPETTTITAGIDIQKDCLYWLVTAWGEDFSGHVLEYGRYPKGNAKMETRWPGCSLEEQVCNSLIELSQTLQAKTYRRDTGEELGIGKVIVDSNWGLLTDAVKKVCRQVQPRCWLEPTQGWGKGPDQRFLAKAKQIGEVRGPEWKKEPIGPKGICRTYTYNTNYWKSFVRARIQAGINARSSLTFYKGDILVHQKFFQHLLGECSSKLTGQYGTMDKWILKPGAPNHWFDCLIMSAVAASASGIKMPEVAINTSPGNKRSGPVIPEAAAPVVTNRKVNVLI